MTEPKDKNEARRLDDILARAAKTIYTECIFAVSAELL